MNHRPTPPESAVESQPARSPEQEDANNHAVPTPADALVGFPPAKEGAPSDGERIDHEDARGSRVTPTGVSIRSPEGYSAEPCRVYEHDGAFKCYAHNRTWGAITHPDEPCASLEGASAAKIAAEINAAVGYPGEGIILDVLRKYFHDRADGCHPFHAPSVTPASEPEREEREQLAKWLEEEAAEAHHLGWSGRFEFIKRANRSASLLRGSSRVTEIK